MKVHGIFLGEDPLRLDIPHLISVEYSNPKPITSLFSNNRSSLCQKYLCDSQLSCRSIKQYLWSLEQGDIQWFGSPDYMTATQSIIHISKIYIYLALLSLPCI